MLAFIFMAALVAYLPTGLPQTNQPHWDNEKTTTFRVPVTLEPGQRLEFLIPLDRQAINMEGDLLVKQVSFEIQTEDGDAVPLPHIYNHHTFLATDVEYRVIGAFGAEGSAEPIRYGDSKGCFVNATEPLIVVGEWIDFFGVVTTSNQTGYCTFTVIYVPVAAQQAAAEKANQLQFSLFGIAQEDGDVEISIPAGPKGGVKCVSGETLWLWDSLRVPTIVGHIHIGGINITLREKGGKKNLVTGHALYDDLGYLIGCQTETSSSSDLIISRNTTYITTACYNNRPSGYEAAMALWGMFYLNLDHPGQFFWESFDIS